MAEFSFTAVHLAGTLGEVAARLPDKPALRTGEGVFTYAELDAAVTRAARALRARGISRGDRVAVDLANSSAFAVLLYGTWRAGGVAVPLNRASPAPELARLIADAEPALVVTEPDRRGVLDEAAAFADWQAPVETTSRLPGVVGPEGEPGVVGPGEEPGVVGPGEEPGVVGDPDDLALLQYTTGTTGRPRGVMLTHRHLSANQAQLDASRQRIAERDEVLAVLPLSHIYGLNVALCYPLRCGATVRLVDRFVAEETLELVSRERISVLLGAPPMFAAWLAVTRRGKVERPDLGAVRVAASGGAPLAPRVLEGFQERFGVALWEGYGLTETSPVLTTTAMGDAPRAGSVGPPVPGVELRLVHDGGRPVASGDPGEVLARGPNVFEGYWRDEEQTADAFTADGWFRTGDLGFVDDGWLHLVDRKSDLIIVSGFNVYPREVEEVLAAHPDVAQAGVVGVPDERTGEVVRAVVVPRQGTHPSPEALVEHCRRFLARFKCPVAVDIVEELPILQTGKVARWELRDSGGGRP
ncbi:AMP-binding protein [Egibacter rhizosphaerae]|nr:AMP-binding protein [Egibacter rhizosphaerae]